MSKIKLKSLIQFLKKRKHNDKKYFIEFLDVKIDSDNLIIVDVNIIPTENFSSYFMDGFTCYIGEIINYGCSLVGIEGVDYQIDLVYFNGKQISLGDYSVSKKMVKQIESYANNELGSVKLTTYHNGNKITVNFYYKYKLREVQSEDDTFWFFVDVHIYRITLDENELNTDNKKLKLAIAGVTFNLLDDNRDILADYCWRLINEEQNIYNCDVYTQVAFYPETVLGNKSEEYGGEYISIEIFKNYLSDFIDGDL